MSTQTATVTTTSLAIDSLNSLVRGELSAIATYDQAINAVRDNPAEAEPLEVEELIRSTGFFRNKTKSLLGMASAVVDRFGGEVPSGTADLVTLPGVGRKTANVLRSVAMGLPGLPVDTHVGRLSRRLGLTTETDPVKVELELNAMVPAAERGMFSLRLILHGRAVCVARNPRCGDCRLADFCPSVGTG